MAHWLISSYQTLARPLLFAMDAEEAHNLGHKLLPALEGVCPSVRAMLLGGDQALLAEKLKTSLAGQALGNPIGLAAGFDKNGKLIKSLAALGFGYVEIGSVTALPSPGNPRPRLFRLPADRALINRLGLNGEGAEAVAANLRRQEFVVPIGANIAKTNRHDIVMENAAEDIAFSFRCLKDLPLAYVTINTSCPNTHDGALFGERELELILTAVQKENNRHLPIFLKLSPDSPEAFLISVLKLANLFDVRGFVLGNTTVKRAELGLRTSPERLAEIGNGGLSGAPLTIGTESWLQSFAKECTGHQELIACGGIATAGDVQTMLKAGAKAVQLYTAMVYDGPFMVMNILRELQNN